MFLNNPQTDENNMVSVVLWLNILAIENNMVTHIVMADRRPSSCNVPWFLISLPCIITIGVTQSLLATPSLGDGPIGSYHSLKS